MISFVYFDVGGVVILDTSGTTKWRDMVKDLGFDDHHIDLFNTLYRNHAKEIAIGDMSVEAFIDMIRTSISIPIPSNYNLNDDLVKRFLPNPSIWPVITEIQKHAQTGLLTNMYTDMFKKIQNAQLFPPHHFDIVVDSSIVHLQKPDKDIYDHAQRQANVPENEILFIDNLEKNLVAPKELGWHTYWYDSSRPEEASQALLEEFLRLNKK